MMKLSPLDHTLNAPIISELTFCNHNKQLVTPCLGDHYPWGGYNILSNRLLAVFNMHRFCVDSHSLSVFDIFLIHIVFVVIAMGWLFSMHIVFVEIAMGC